MSHCTFGTWRHWTGGWIHSIQESNSSAFLMFRWCSWTHFDRQPRNWNYLQIYGSLWRVVVATCKSKHPWQSNWTWGTTAYFTREPRHFHPFVPISIWQLVSLGLICRAAHWCRDSFVLHCSPASPLLPSEPVTCKHKKNVSKILWHCVPRCLLGLRLLLTLQLKQLNSKGYAKKTKQEKTEIEVEFFLLLKSRMNIDFLPPVWVFFWTLLWNLAPPSHPNASRSKQHTTYRCTSTALLGSCGSRQSMIKVCKASKHNWRGRF